MQPKKHLVAIAVIIASTNILTAAPITGDGLPSNAGSLQTLPGFGPIHFALTSPDDGLSPAVRFSVDAKKAFPTADGTFKFGMTGAAPGAASKVRTRQVLPTSADSSTGNLGVNPRLVGGGSGSNQSSSVGTGPTSIPEPRAQLVGLALIFFCLGGRIHRRRECPREAALGL